MPEVKIVGIDAVKHLANKYSWNVYVNDYASLQIIAYPQKLMPDGTYQTNTDKEGERIFRVLMCQKNNRLCSIALEDEHWISGPSWMEYDSWIGADEVARMYIENIAFADWFENNIVDYVEEIYTY